MKRNLAIIFGAAFVVFIGGVAYFIHEEYESTEGIPFPSQEVEAPLSAAVVPFTEIAHGVSSAIPARVNYFLISADQLHELWEIVGVAGRPPSVDFNTQSVLAIFAGDEPSSAIAVSKIEDADTRLVSIVLAKPDTACTADKSEASPYQMVVVSTTTLPLAHKDIFATTTCSN